MSALYQVRYHGVAGEGHGAIYIGNGKVLGVDITGARYNGTYTQNGDSLAGTVTLTANGGQLVTGQPAPPGAIVQITFNLPQNFGDSQFRALSVGGRSVQVAFTKIGDIP